jgi:hypothetical protein
VKRIVRHELLDTLPSGDPRAVRSRRDLRRVNGWMRNHAIMADALQNALPRHAPGQFTDLGAGDGTFLLRVAQRLGSFGVPPSGGPCGQSSRTPRLGVPAVENDTLPCQTENRTATLLDLRQNVSAETLASLAALGWHAEPVVADVFAWLRASEAGGVVIANLFLHHFGDARLEKLLCLISQRAKLFIAVEPRRASWPLFCSRLLWAVGCNDVTRHDAVISVRAGFSGNELSAFWPDRQSWRLAEHRAGTFSHLFIARKIS